MSPCSAFRWTEHNLGAKFLSGMFLGLSLGTNEMYIGTTTGVGRADAIKRKTEPRTVCLGRVERSRGCVETDSRRAGCRWCAVPAARYTIAEGGGSLYQCSQQGGGLGPPKVYICAVSEIERRGTTPDCQGCDAILTRSTAKNHGTQRRERLMREMQHDERQVRRVQAVEDRKRRRPNAEGKRDAVRPRSMQQDDVENNESRVELGSDRNRDQSGSGDTQLEGHAVQGLAQGSDLLRQCCNETQTEELGVPRSGARQSHGHGHEQLCDE